MKTKWIFALCILLILAFGQVYGQTRSIRPVGVGVRLDPDGAGLTGKFLLDRDWAIEAQFNGSQGFYHGLYGAPNYGSSGTVVGLLEYTIIFPDPAWRVFLGPGIHAGMWNVYSKEGTEYDKNQPIVGVDGILGIEYIFYSLPIGISADVKPAVNFINFDGYFPNNFFGLSARYYIGFKRARTDIKIRK